MQWLGGYRLRSERPLSSPSHKAEPNVRREHPSPDQGLRNGLTRLDSSQVEALTASLRKHASSTRCVADEKISLAMRTPPNPASSPSPHKSANGATHTSEGQSPSY